MKQTQEQTISWARLLSLFGTCLLLLFAGCVQTVAPEQGEIVPNATSPIEAQTQTILPTPSPPPTPRIASGGIESTRLLWEWAEVARPTAAQPTQDRVGVVAADGRFLWLSAETGRSIAAAFIWESGVQGDTEANLIANGTLAVLSARELSISPESGLVNTRARLVIYDGEANELWSLSELGTQRFYSSVLTTNLVVTGTWPYGFEDNSLAAYEVFTGQQSWEIEENGNGFQQILSDNTLLYVLVNEETGSAVVGYDLRSGIEVWRWRDEDLPQPTLIARHETTVYVLDSSQVIALEAETGRERWRSQIGAATEAGFRAFEAQYFTAIPPSEDNTRPGVAAFSVEDGALAWNALAGLVVDPLTATDEALWLLVKNYDSGEVALSGVDLESGLEQVRVPIGRNPNVLYSVAAEDELIIVGGDTLRAYGY